MNLKIFIYCFVLVIFSSTIIQGVSAERDYLYFEDEEIEYLNWWNERSVQRVWGCDTCEVDDIACSLGASIAAKRGDPSRPCGFDEKRTDYYGYLDPDDWRKWVNPIYEKFDTIYDNKTDYESGIPDIAIVDYTVKSIETDIDAYFVLESIWNMPPFWMSLYDKGPGGNNVDWQEWLMPCADQAGVDYRCEWQKDAAGNDKCKQAQYAPCTECVGCPSCTYLDPLDPTNTLTCNCGLVWVDVPITTCTNWAPGDPFKQGGPPTVIDQLCCWKCVPRVPAQQDAAASYCGPGGASIEEDNQSYDHFVYKSDDVVTSEIRPPLEYKGYYGYPHNRERSGIDLNDDLKIFEMSDGTWYIPNFPDNHPDVLNNESAEDLVRDRYWKHNSTDNEFKGSRPGYCTWEGYYDPAGNGPTMCEEGDHNPYGVGPARAERDDWNRPGSKQHDPCAPCQGYDYIYPNLNDPKMCYKECFNYDLRYYRQFNIDSVWVNVFKIVPEINYPFTPDGRIPDTQVECLDTRPGNDECTLMNTHEGPCTNDNQCIPVLECVRPKKGVTGPRLCCPPGTEARLGCCRNPDNQKCVIIDFDCPPDKITNYLWGIGEPFCDQDDECAEYKDSEDPTQITTQHCSFGGF